MRFVQHKKEAYWFYRFLASVYDRWVNPLFWTPQMRDRALALARLDAPDLRTLDVGAGTGFTTEGVVAHVAADRVTLLDQSPHQLARARAKPALRACAVRQGDAEALPFADASFDRYVSAGSIEYWPEPQRAIAEAHRVLRPGGVALLAGPLPPANPVARRLAAAWMLFPTEAQYRTWFERAGFADVAIEPLPAPWDPAGRRPYAVAVAGTRPEAGPPPLALPERPGEDLAAPMSARRRALFAARFALGSLAGAAFVPVGVLLTLRARRRVRTAAP